MKSHIDWGGKRSILYKGVVLKTLKESPKEKAQRGQYMLAVGLGHYKWYQSQTPGDVLERRPSPEGGWTRDDMLARMLVPKRGGLGGPTSIREMNKCQR